MTQRGFMEPSRLSPAGLGIVIAMHAAALGALALAKGPQFFEPPPPIRLIDIERPPEPPPPDTLPEPRREQPRTRQQESVIDRVPPLVDRLATTGPVVDEGPREIPPLVDRGTETISETRVELPPPVRIAAEFDPRYARDQQPPYPPTEERAGREGSVRLRVTVGADGRVKAVQRLSSTSSAFWQATERHAMARWRFRPATLDGRPIESSKTLTIYFRLQG